MICGDAAPARSTVLPCDHISEYADRVQRGDRLALINDSEASSAKAVGKLGDAERAKILTSAQSQ